MFVNVAMMWVGLYGAHAKQQHQAECCKQSKEFHDPSPDNLVSQAI
jgi:hypothetical protein